MSDGVNGVTHQTTNDLRHSPLSLHHFITAQL
jgi:hypothetical protein